MKGRKLLEEDGWIYSHQQGIGEVWKRGHFFMVYYPSQDVEEGELPRGVFGCSWTDETN